MEEEEGPWRRTGYSVERQILDEETVDEMAEKSDAKTSLSDKIKKSMRWFAFITPWTSLPLHIKRIFLVLCTSEYTVQHIESQLTNLLSHLCTEFWESQINQCWVYLFHAWLHVNQQKMGFASLVFDSCLHFWKQIPEKKQCLLFGKCNDACEIRKRSSSALFSHSGVQVPGWRRPSCQAFPLLNGFLDTLSGRTLSGTWSLESVWESCSYRRVRIKGPESKEWELIFSVKPCAVCTCRS